MRARNIPSCKFCRGVSRPNILMFGDYAWLPGRTNEQEGRYKSFLGANRGKKMVVIEMGAGKAVPTIRYTSERLGEKPDTTVIRINPREAEIGVPHISLEFGALEGLQKIDALL